VSFAFGGQHTKAGCLQVESIWDSQIRTVLIQHAGWNGGQHGWANRIQWIFANGWLPRLSWRPVLPSGGGQFGVGVSTAIIWVRRLRETGSVAPGQMGGHKPKAISGAHRAWLLERTKARDFTLRGLVAELAERGFKVDYRAVWNFVHAERLSFVPLSRYRVPKIAQHAAFGHMNDYDLETQSCGWVVELLRLTIARQG
jgi:transposase